jgi:hypothetical protein
VTTPTTPRPEPARARSLATDQAATSARTTRILATIALVVALVALGFAAWRMLVPADAGCQEQAWDVTPDAEDLPAGWIASASQYDIDRKTMSFLGPTPEDEASSQAVIYATVTCFRTGAEDGVTRSRAAAEAAGQSVADREDLGEQAYSAVDDSGAAFLQVRAGKIVVYLAASGDASATEVDELASAFDKALDGDGGIIAPPAVVPSDDQVGASLDPGASPDPGESSDPGESPVAESPAAPDLVALMPTQVGSIAMDSDSATGGTFLSDDQGSRAITAALRAAGKAPDDLRVAQAFDESGVSDLLILAVTVDGFPGEQTRDIVLENWLAATGEGVTKDTVTLAGQTWTRIDYGDGGTLDYVLTDGANVIVITTADAALAEQTAAALP